MNNHILSVKLNIENYPTKEHYPFSLPIFNHNNEVVFDAPVTFFVGENGTGKSTLLEAIAIACGIHIWKRDGSARFESNSYEKQLHKYINVNWENGRAEGAYFGSDIFSDFRRIVDSWAAADPGQLEYFGGKSLLTQSHGQSMMSYFESRYKIKGLYFLDEPETALSPKSLLKLLTIIKKNVQLGHAQFIVATHSPILMSFNDAKIYSFDRDIIKSIKYKDTEHYKIYKSFLSEI